MLSTGVCIRLTPQKSLFLIFRKEGTKKKENRVTLPVYLNAARAQLLFTLEFETDSSSSDHSFYERGVGIISSDLA